MGSKNISADWRLSKCRQCGSANIAMTEKTAVRSFPALDGLRGIAAVLVVQFHIRSLFMGYIGFPAGDGYLAVDIFFSLSGFVLAHAYLEKFQRGMSLLEFAKIRVIRLYPLYLLGLLVASIVFAIQPNENASPQNTASIIALEIFFLPARAHGNNQLFPINTVAWSLFFELLVNLFFVLLWKYLTRRVLANILVVSGLALFAYVLHKQTASLGNMWGTAPGGLLRAVFSFTVGLLLHDLYASGKLRFNVGPGVFYAGICVLAAYLTLPASDNVRSYYDMLFILIISPALIIIGVNVSLSGKTARVFSFLGVASYALYCLHLSALPAIAFLSEKFYVGQPPLPFISIVSVLLFLLASYFIDAFYDIPVRRALSARLISTSKRNSLKTQSPAKL
jgi:peptidoglycan/LPS O-acetylase OafA/YrhL